MSSTSQASYASRLAKAEQLYQFISSFQDYEPGVPELTAASLQNMIADLSTTQSDHTLTHHDYAESAKERKKIFSTNPYSITKSLTMANSYLRAKKGSTSQQYIDVNNLIQKIRGNRNVSISINAKEDTISHIERSYGSQLQNFTDIITLLVKYNSDYVPSNANIKITALQNLLGEAIEINNKVTISYSAFKPKINERQTGFKNLSFTATRIKGMVKAQYGSKSVEYEMIKNLRFH